WRGYSDFAWSDADGEEDTDGLGAIDNVTITLPTATTPIVISDDFESGDFSGLSTTNGTANWTPGGLEGISYDSWHMLYDPVYGGEGNTCTFSDDWMWSLKPQEGFPPGGEANGFRMYLVSPALSLEGWTGGVIQYSMFLCMPPVRDDLGNVRIRWYDACGAWSQWRDADDGYWTGGCTFWNMNQTENLTPYLGASVESLQVAWESYDTSLPGEPQWNRHGSVQYFVDNVSFGSFDGTATQFQARTIDIFADTFSRVDPAHTSFLGNSEQGLWPTEAFEDVDSLTVQITDVDGLSQVTPNNGRVTLWFRHDNGTGPHAAGQSWTGWVSKDMDYSVPDPTIPGWGDYRMIFGEDSGVGFESGGEDGTGAVDGFLWNAGTTVQYYVKVIDDSDNAATFPRGASDPEPSYLEWSILPFGVNTDGVKTALDGLGGETHLLVVDSYERNALDFEQSTGFVSGGGAGFGTFEDPVFTPRQRMIERSLTLLYGGDATPETFDPRWDKYDVTGANWSVRCEPRGQAAFPGIGGYGNDLGNPLYDALIWISGADGYVFEDTTRIELSNFLDRGGKLLSMGDDTVFDLAFEGNNTDSIIGFVRDYMGCDL
ncbi:MAG: hypothetical protein VKI81_11080, partial [Synechococcaceae cyanobacterium]|nr:hypothetical protein [Synechococcaceae cyanobacterium]